MSLEEDLERQLLARSAGVHVAPDLDDLGRRISDREHRVQRRERLALSTAVVVLAASVGGLVGAVVGSPHASPTSSNVAGFDNGGGKQADQAPTSSTETPSTGGRPSTVPATIVNEALPGGLHVAATLQPLATPLAITLQSSGAGECSRASVVTTTVGQDGQFGGGTAVTSLPALSPSGLEILSSGILQLPGGGEAWWATTAVGSAVARVAAENLGGAPAAATPSHGIAVVAGPISTTSTSDGDMSAVAEAADGQSLHSLAFVLGEDPIVVGEAPTPRAAGCSAASMPAAPQSATSSQPADPQLDAAAIAASYEQAYSADPLLGFSANLAAVEGGAILTSPPAASTKQGDGGDSHPEGKPTLPTTQLNQSSSDALVGAPLGIQQISFTSASSATVVYAVENVSFTGQATLGADGIWRVTRQTFCGAVLVGLVQGDVPPDVLSACGG